MTADNAPMVSNFRSLARFRITIRPIILWCGARASRPKAQKKLTPKWHKSDPKVTGGTKSDWGTKSDSKSLKSDLKVTFCILLVTFESLFLLLWCRPEKSLLSHFFVTLIFSRAVGLAHHITTIIITLHHVILWIHYVWCNVPSDTKLLHTKIYSEIIIFRKITNLTRNPLKMSFFPGDFERTKCLKN